jgi:hypothetical protein
MPKCDGGQTLANENVVVPQFGSVASLSVERRLFSERTTQAKSGPWGDLVDVKYTDRLAGGDRQPVRTMVRTDASWTIFVGIHQPYH